jgi:hypothetical protein
MSEISPLTQQFIKFFWWPRLKKANKKQYRFRDCPPCTYLFFFKAKHLYTPNITGPPRYLFSYVEQIVTSKGLVGATRTRNERCLSTLRGPKFHLTVRKVTLAKLKSPCLQQFASRAIFRKVHCTIIVQCRCTTIVQFRPFSAVQPPVFRPPEHPAKAREDAAKANPKMFR